MSTILKIEGLDEINKKLDAIMKALPVAEKVNALTEYIPEAQARKILNKSTSWFWNQRKACKLKSHKVGGTRYYHIDDLEEFIKHP